MHLVSGEKGLPLRHLLDNVLIWKLSLIHSVAGKLHNRLDTRLDFGLYIF